MRSAPILAASLLLIAACTSVADPFMTVVVTGTVTQGGEPAPARIRLAAAGFALQRDFPDGVYSITTGGGGVPESYCDEVRITANLLSADGSTVLDTQSREIGACGEFGVDFEFP